MILLQNRNIFGHIKSSQRCKKSVARKEHYNEFTFSGGQRAVHVTSRLYHDLQMPVISKKFSKNRIGQDMDTIAYSRLIRSIFEVIIRRIFRTCRRLPLELATTAYESREQNLEIDSRQSTDSNLSMVIEIFSPQIYKKRKYTFQGNKTRELLEREYATNCGSIATRKNGNRLTELTKNAKSDRESDREDEKTNSPRAGKIHFGIRTRVVTKTN